MTSSKPVRRRDAEGAKRKDLQLYTDPQSVQIVGLDTDHKNKAEHDLWDARALDPVDESLALSIARYGVVKAVTVRRDGAKRWVVDGRKRTKAWRRSLEICKANKWPPQPIKVEFLQASDLDVLAISRTANAFSTPDTPLQKAEDLARFINAGMSPKEAGVIYGENESMVRKLLKLNDCSTRVQKAVERGVMDVSAAARLAVLSREEQDKELALMLAGEAQPLPAPWTCHARPTGKPCGHVNPPGTDVCEKCGRTKIASDNRQKDEAAKGGKAAAKPAKPARATVKKVEERLRERSGKPVATLPKERLAAAAEKLQVFMDTADGQGAAGDAGETDRVQTFLRSLQSDLSNTSPPVQTHHDDCWRLPGHHPCAITRIETLEEMIEREREGEAEE